MFKERVYKGVLILQNTVIIIYLSLSDYLLYTWCSEKGFYMEYLIWSTKQALELGIIILSIFLGKETEAKKG